MPIYRLTNDAIIELPKASYAQRGIKERADLQRLLKANIAVVAPDVLVISEEFGEWEDSKRRIDLLGIDRDASLVVIELKRDEEGGHMELQAIRYAAMVSRMTFQRAINVYQSYLDNSTGGDARTTILDFLHTSEPPRDDKVLDVRIVLVSADFAKELTTAVLWLNEWELDIRCVKVKPYNDGDGIILEVQQVVPLPEAAEYQISIRDEAISRREVARESGDPTGYWFMNTGDGSNDGRSWDDCKKYGFMLAGGGDKWIRDAQKLKVGDRVFAYLSGYGYVGFGIVIAEAVTMKDFIPSGHNKPILNLPLTAEVQRDRMNDPDHSDWCVSIKWIRALDREKALLKSRFRRSTLEQIRKPDLVADLLAQFKIQPDEI